ncbi:MAG: oligosaccharide flippase family protein [Candidatus Thorarchaeota archaeon]|jgi:O-antigen/teichoic acid export membrane protein
MSNEVGFSNELRLLSRSASLVMVGILFSTGFEFISRLVMAHNLTLSEYGSISLGLRLLQITLFVSLVGVNVGIPPLMAASADDDNELEFLIGGSLIIALLTSSLVTVSLVLLSDTLGNVYGIAALAEIIRTLAWAIIPLVIIKVTTGVLRGLGKYKPKILIEDLLLGSSRLIFILFALFLATGVIGVSTAIAVASLIISIVYVLHFIRINTEGCSIRISSAKRVLTFSAPLLWKGLASEITVSIDIMLLGVFATSSVVGVFSATVTISQVINIVGISFAYLFSPVIAQVLSRRNWREARGLYVAVSKWSLIFTFPFFLTIILYPQTVLSLFGISYVGGASSLRVLACAYFIHSVFGLSSITVTSYGKPTVDAIAWTLGIPVGFTVAYSLIPMWGGVGAALGTLAGLIVVNSINICFIRRKLGVFPFSQAHAKSLVGVLSLSVVLAIMFPEPASGFGFVWLPVIFLCITILSFFGVLLSRGFSPEDVVLLELVEEITHLKMHRIRTILSKLVR